MPDSTDRVERFKEEVAHLRLREPRVRREQQLLRLGVALMVLGPAVGVYAYSLSHSTTNALQQRDAIVVALTGVALAVTGAALFLRYSIAQFLRFWLARLSLEHRAETDRVVDATGRPPAG